MGTGGGQQNLWDAEFPLEQGVAFHCEGAIARDVRVRDGLAYVFEFIANRDGAIEINARIFVHISSAFADQEGEIVKPIVVKERDILREIAFAVIE